MRPPLALALAATASLMPACAGPAVGPSVPGGGQVPVEPTLSSISAVVFTPKCTSTACHGGTGSAPLDLTPERAYATLVYGPSTQTTEMPVVTPRDLEQSYLMLKLLGTHASTGVGAVMPPDGERLPDDELAAIAAWILGGAPND
jgi:mono/diheme cytochrome c family protein